MELKTNQNLKDKKNAIILSPNGRTGSTSICTYYSNLLNVKNLEEVYHSHGNYFSNHKYGIKNLQDIKKVENFVIKMFPIVWKNLNNPEKSFFKELIQKNSTAVILNYRKNIVKQVLSKTIKDLYPNKNSNAISTKDEEFIVKRFNPNYLDVCKNIQYMNTHIIKKYNIKFVNVIEYEQLYLNSLFKKYTKRNSTNATYYKLLEYFEQQYNQTCIFDKHKNKLVIKSK